MLSRQNPKQATVRQMQIVEQFILELAKHMNDLELGQVNDKYTVQQFAELLHLHPIHFTNVIKKATSRTPCDFYKESLIETAKRLLSDHSLSIARVAERLTFDPSNFSKFFKRMTGESPKQYRESSFLIEKLKPSPF
jgi:AraC family transcriptional regulator, regulatory protein of adaptative response / methylphosphotriester-DNA alkyltransferase methyltransferase